MGWQCGGGAATAGWSTSRRGARTRRTCWPGVPRMRSRRCGVDERGVYGRDAGPVEEGYARMVFNVLTHSHDHTCNFACLMDAAGVRRLSPTFGLTFRVGPCGEHTTLNDGEGSQPTCGTSVGWPTNRGSTSADEREVSARRVYVTAAQMKGTSAAPRRRSQRRRPELLASQPAKGYTSPHSQCYRDCDSSSAARGKRSGPPRASMKRA